MTEALVAVPEVDAMEEGAAVEERATTEVDAGEEVAAPAASMEEGAAAERRSEVSSASGACEQHNEKTQWMDGRSGWITDGRRGER